MKNMSNQRNLLNKAIKCVSQEQQCLQREREAFQKFREAISRMQATRSGNRDNGIDDTTEELREVYRETVMSIPSHETAYDESISESLKQEFTPTLANALLKNKAVTQQRKRNLLVATTAAINRRNEFKSVLEQEHKSLAEIRDALIKIEESVRELPVCSIQQLPFESYVNCWEGYEKQIGLCDYLVKKRQRHFVELQDQFAKPINETHAVNEYLYTKLATPYPALRSITEMRQRIERDREPLVKSNCAGGHGERLTEETVGCSLD